VRNCFIRGSVVRYVLVSRPLAYVLLYKAKFFAGAAISETCRHSSPQAGFSNCAKRFQVSSRNAYPKALQLPTC
jgi:hypothetical protein